MFNNKLRYREEHSVSDVLSWCTLWHLSGDKKTTYQQLINHFCMKLAMKPIEFREITQNNGHYNVQGRSRSPIFVPIESHTVYEFLLVINSNWPSILHRFQVTADYMQHFG